MNYVLTENAVGKIRRAIAPSAGNTGAVGAIGRPIDPDTFPAPFTVRWSASANQAAGAWVIWLPDTAKLVCIGNSYQSAPSNIAAETALPSGWYRMTTVGATATAVYLNITTYTLTGQIFLDIGATPGQAQTGYSVVSLLIATMSTNAQTGAKAVKQFIDSAITFGGGGGGGGVTLDDVSLDWTTNNEAQIKDWDTGTPASSTTIAQDIHDGNTTAQGTVVERTTGGVLKYKKPGTLAQLLGSSVSLSSQKILTGLSWSTSNHTLVISSATVTVANGVITAWVANNDETIPTTPISSIIN